MDAVVGIRSENIGVGTDRLIAPVSHKKESGSVKETIHNNPELYRKHLYKNFANAYEEVNAPFPEIVPETIVHIEQVALVAKCIFEEAEMFGLTHDAGRESDTKDLIHDNLMAQQAATLNIKNTYQKWYNSNNHPLAGHLILRAEGFDEDHQNFALDHHQMGLGFPIVGRESVKSIILKGQEDLTHIDVDAIPDEDLLLGVQHIDKLYGVRGLAGILADLSKTYETVNGIPSNTPTIAVFTPENANILIQRLLGKGDMKENDDRHKTEKLGARYVGKMIEFLKEKYGIDYEAAVGNAQKRWEGKDDKGVAQKDKIQKLWTETIHPEHKPINLPIRYEEQAVAADDK